MERPQIKVQKSTKTKKRNSTWSEKEDKVLIEKAKEVDADIIGLSALMTTTMMEMKKVVALAKEENVRAKIMIGGAVITQGFADEIGADGYSKDAQEAVEVAGKLLQNE